MRRTLVDVTSVVIGVAASWLIADAIISLDERRKPLALEPHKLPEHFRSNERIQGNFHLGMAVYDAMHIAFHAQRTVASPDKKKPYYASQAAWSCVRFGYHVAWAYVKHHRDHVAPYER